MISRSYTNLLELASENFPVEGREKDRKRFPRVMILQLGLARSLALGTCIFGVVQLKHDLIGRMKENWTQERLAAILLVTLNALGAISFTIPHQDLSLKIEMGNARFLEDVEFGGEENIRNVVFEEEFVIGSDQVFVPIIVQDATPVLDDNVRALIPDIVQNQDNTGTLPQEPPEEQTQQPQEVPLRRSTRERRSAIPDDYLANY